MATWTVSTYYKKSCEEHEHYYKDDQTITRKTGYRGATFIVETSDDNPPEFEFDYVPGGDGKLDSINMDILRWYIHTFNSSILICYLQKIISKIAQF